MKFLLLVLMSVPAFAATTIHCRTEKEEVDVKDEYFMAGDTNQRIDMELKEETREGKTVLVSKEPQLLKYEFSQSTGGDSPWAMLVDSVVVDGKDVELNVVISRDSKKVFKETINLKVFETGGDSSEVAILNKKLAINGKHVVYNATEEEVGEMFKTFIEMVRKEEMKTNDLVWLQIASCRLKE